MARTIHSEPSRTFAEYRLLTGFTAREAAIEKISLRTPLVKYDTLKQAESQIMMNIPFLSAAMQAVTGTKMAVALARKGGMGVVYCSQPIESQAEMVRAVKNYRAGFVIPDVFSPDTYIHEVVKRIDQKGYSSFPITDTGRIGGKLMGIITKSDFNRERHMNSLVKERMTTNIVVGKNMRDLHEASELLRESHVSCIPVVDSEGRLQSIVFRKDVDENISNPHAVMDDKKRLRVGAAISTHDYNERVPVLLEAGADVLFIDSSDGYTVYQKDCLEFMRDNYPNIPVVGGNVISKDGFDFLVENGAWAVKVGMGGGSICITQEQKGTGRGQATAVRDCVEARNAYLKKTGIYIPIISDGGIVTSRDMVIALSIGADSLMMGRYFARFDESPTEVDRVKGLKPYWGEGSERARTWQKARYSQAIFSEGVDGYVPYLGPMKKTLSSTLLKIKASMSSAGCASIRELHEKAILEPVSELAIREGKAHDIIMSDELGAYKEVSWGE